MKKSELKNLIKECVREIVFEEGAIKTIVAEVAQGLVTTQPLVEQRQPIAAKPQDSRVDVRAKIMEAMNKDRDNDPYATARQRMPNSNLFEGTVPIDQRESNSGVDIRNIPGIQNWGTIANNLGKKG